jgi:deazaflavin-dependent oxidoreductase (nitroreductase family)
MTLRQPARSALALLGTKRGRHLDAKVVHLTGYSAYGYLYGKDMGRQGRPKPPMNLTTIGHRSGRLHTVALAYFPIDDGWAVVGSAGGSEREPDWVRNARANRAAWVRLQRRTVPVEATVLDGAAKKPIWDEIASRVPVFSAFQDGVTRDIPIVVLRPRAVPPPPAG